MLNDIVLLMTGSIMTLVGMFAINKGAKSLAEKIAPAVLTPTPALTTSPTPSSASGFNWMGFQNPTLDEDWRPPPPPTTPPDFLHPEREEIANERAAAGVEQ